jgi:hypothetical protein
MTLIHQVMDSLSLSSTEAEYKGLNEAARECVHLHDLLNGLVEGIKEGIYLSNLVSELIDEIRRSCWIGNHIMFMPSKLATLMLITKKPLCVLFVFKTVSLALLQ